MDTCGKRFLVIVGAGLIGSQAYDFIYASDCAMKANSTDTFYNIGSGAKTTTKEFASLILEVASSRLKIQYEQGVMTFAKNRVVSPKKVEKEIDFKAEVSLREGLYRGIQR